MADSQTTVEQKPSAAVRRRAGRRQRQQGTAEARADRGRPDRAGRARPPVAACGTAAINFVETENAYVTGHVHPVSARIPGVVTKVLFDDNQMVKAGDVLAELDPADQGVKVEQIQAQIASVQQQIVQADAAVEQAKAQASAAGAQVAQSAGQPGARQAGRRALRPAVQHPDEGRLEGRGRRRHRRPRRRHRRRHRAPRQRRLPPRPRSPPPPRRATC